MPDRARQPRNVASQPRHAPPWWPEGEAWPPDSASRVRPWRAMRGRFFWRVGAIFALLFIVAGTLGTVFFWVVASALGLISGHGDVATAPFLWRGPFFGVIVFVIVMAAVAFRAMRRAAVPIADLMEAAKKVELGDYAVRIHARGPREVRELAEAFNAMASRLQENEDQRRNMLADVTHELRTPLTIIQGNLEGLLDGIYPRDDTHLSIILDETRVFARLVEDLRTLAQAESGTLILQREPIDLAALIHEIVASFAMQADIAGLSLFAKVEPDLPSVLADATRIHAVLANLVVNAMRYTPKGGTIVIEAHGVSSSGPIQVTVTDTGRGIDPEVLPHIFDRFYKSSDSRGSGLGLAIARHLVEAHGGEIKAECVAEGGTRITFTLPIESHADS